LAALIELTGAERVPCTNGEADSDSEDAVLRRLARGERRGVDTSCDEATEAVSLIAGCLLDTSG
jgi:hypothetical protein